MDVKGSLQTFWKLANAGRSEGDRVGATKAKGVPLMVRVIDGQRLGEAGAGADVIIT
jgi:hypothetical protein